MYLSSSDFLFRTSWFGLTVAWKFSLCITSKARHYHNVGKHQVPADNATSVWRPVLQKFVHESERWGWTPDAGYRPDRLAGGDVRERRLAKFRQNVARFRLYRLRFLQQNMRFAAFFKIYQILKLTFLKFGKICKFCDMICKILLNFHEKLIADFSNCYHFYGNILKFQRCKNAQIL